ncbi:hypothetical protein BC629DRAFT_362893 [Irpex lacteus]|nr:hypothetical protein BC629DRAFT_362893 [Irpex lacteus]
MQGGSATDQKCSPRCSSSLAPAMTTPTMNWNDLPTEMKQAVVDRLALHDSRVFARTSHGSYLLCVPTLYRDINLHSPSSLQSFLLTVPLSHCKHVRTLSLNLSGSTCAATATNNLVKLLEHCTELLEFAIRTPGVLKPTIVQAFAGLKQLQRLTIRGCVESDSPPLSERLITSIALSLPSTLTSLSLSTITRSSLHAPELVGTSPFIPVVSGDHDVPSSQALSLPSLLLLPHLKELRITDTHLGDLRWESTSVRCSQLEVLELGGCCEESPERNGMFVERIVRRVGRDAGVRKLVLGAGISGAALTGIIDTDGQFESYTSASTGEAGEEGIECITDANVVKETNLTATRMRPLPHLTSLTLTALVPLEHLASTLSALALSESPIETINLEWHEDDVEEGCEVLGEWLGSCDAYSEDEEGVDMWCASPMAELEAFDWGSSSSSSASVSSASSLTREGSAFSFASTSSTSTSQPQLLSARSSISSLSSASDYDTLRTPLDGTSMVFPPPPSYHTSSPSYSSYSHPMLTPKPHIPPPPETRTRTSRSGSRVGRPFPSLRKLSLSSVSDVLDPEACKTRVVEFEFERARGGMGVGVGVLEQLRGYLSSSSSSPSSSPDDMNTTSSSSSPGLPYDEGSIYTPCGVKRSEFDTMGDGNGNGNGNGDGTQRKLRVLGDLELDGRMRDALRDVAYETW